MNGDEEVFERYLVPDEFSDELLERLARDGGNITNALKRDREGTLKLLKRDAVWVRAKIVLGFLLAQAMLIVSFLLATWAVAREAALPKPN